MTRPVRIQLSRKAGFDLQAASRAVNGLPAIKVDRSARWGNPYPVGAPVDLKQARRWGWRIGQPDFVCIDAEQSVRRFAASLGLDGAAIHDVRQNLRGANLACWCRLDEPFCHADTLLGVANPAPGAF